VAEPVDIILLSYNRLDYLAAMVDAIEEHTRWPYRLTVVDNASGPQTRQWLRDYAARFHQIVWNERNEHLAGLQRGIEATAS
jgi:GT2 family glycosyltransferase